MVNDAEFDYWLFSFFQQVAEEAVKSADKRASQLEEEVRGKNEQLEDMYTQIDSMQECIDSLEQDKSEHSASQAIA